MRSRRAGGALSARRLDQLVMGAQAGRYLGVLRLQNRDHRLQKDGIIREVLRVARHATDHHRSGRNAIKTRVFRRINHPTRAGGAPQSGLRQSMPRCPAAHACMRERGPQHGQLRQGQAHRAITRRRPWKVARLKHLVVTAKALLAPLSLGPMAFQCLITFRSRV